MGKKNSGVHITPHKNAGRSDWQVKSEGAKRASAVFKTQAEAAKFGRKQAIHKEAELFLHGRNGQIRERNSYGHDPVERKG